MERDEVISRGLGRLAGQAGPPRIDVAEVARLVRRRRGRYAAVGLAGSAALAAGVVGGLTLWPDGPSTAAPALPAATSSPRHPAAQHCGAPRGTGPRPGATASGPGASRQQALDQAADRIEQIAGGGKDVTRGWSGPGAYARWYGGVEVDTGRGQVVVYRVPGSGLDAAVCSQVRDVTVELRDALRSAADAQRLAGRISAEVGLGRPGPGFRLFSMAVRPDGTLSFTSDHPDAARRALRGYGPGLVVTAGLPATAL